MVEARQGGAELIAAPDLTFGACVAILTFGVYLDFYVLKL
jgi:hypothetical protein